MAELWEFAQASYQAAGVAGLCLELQDRWGADINLLLAGAWLAEQGRRWDRETVAALVAACREWRTRCLLPQRVVRRQLKGMAPELYRQALALELAMERRQLDIIETWLQAHAARSSLDDEIFGNEPFNDVVGNESESDKSLWDSGGQPRHCPPCDYRLRHNLALALGATAEPIDRDARNACLVELMRRLRAQKETLG